MPITYNVRWCHSFEIWLQLCNSKLNFKTRKILITLWREEIGWTPSNNISRSMNITKIRRFDNLHPQYLQYLWSFFIFYFKEVSSQIVPMPSSCLIFVIWKKYMYLFVVVMVWWHADDVDRRHNFLKIRILGIFA